MTVLTLTPNPSLDRSYEIPGLGRGAVLRAVGDRVDPGGKGVNVSRAVAAAGHRTVAVLPLGGPEGALLSRLLGELGIAVAGVPVRGSTRVNVALAESDGTLTKVNAAGPEVSEHESRALLETVAVEAARARSGERGATWLACCGSLPRGLADEWYAALVARAREAGVRVALDSSGPALAAALAERPDVVKPNAEELAEVVGRPLATVGDAVKAAEEVRAAGAGAVLASLGATGQLLVNADGARFASAPVEVVRSDVGAGDASLAGFLTVLASGGTGSEALASAVAHGAAAVQLPGSQMPAPDDLRPESVTVTTDVPLDLPLGLALSPVPSPNANGVV
ncbi:1-phosphofructokinase [Streptomyces sp. NPDC048172]|uniref:1-phosphofructokinase n=1 Tax=Streptomyces sp. NPDC048172 TaxID=3365505 RepID=UPI0037221077